MYIHVYTRAQTESAAQANDAEPTGRRSGREKHRSSAQRSNAGTTPACPGSACVYTLHHTHTCVYTLHHTHTCVYTLHHTHMCVYTLHHTHTCVYTLHCTCMYCSECMCVYMHTCVCVWRVCVCVCAW